MDELLKDNFLLRALVTALMGIWVLLVTYGTFIKTKNMNNKKLKILLRVGVCIALICFWVYFFLYLGLYPVSLAYYEYKNDVTMETTGVINGIEQEDKDRMCLIIDNKKYTMPHSNINPFVIIGRDIDEGDTVKIRFGKKSKFIFDIYESNAN